MKIVLDNLVYSLQNFGGISTYWYELSIRFLEDENLDILFYETGSEGENVYRKKMRINDSQIVKSNRGGLIFERFLNLPSYNKENIFHSSYFRIPKKNPKTTIISTVHDFTHDLFYSGPRVWLHNFMKKEMINQSDRIITVSNNTRNDLLNFYPNINPDKVHVIYNGVSDDFCVLNSPANGGVPYFLFIGSREHYKNFDFAVQITSKFKAFNLFIVGAPLSKKELSYVSQQLGTRYKIITGAGTEELNLLYNNAFCLLYPSSYEGFGIPLLEAMRAGCPFIAMNWSSIPEVAGDAGVLLEERNMEHAEKAVEYIMNNRQMIIIKGLEQSQNFSWDKTFQETKLIYGV